jgi:hypothetical protein
MGSLISNPAAPPSLCAPMGKQVGGGGGRFCAPDAPKSLDLALLGAVPLPLASANRRASWDLPSPRSGEGGGEELVMWLWRRREMDRVGGEWWGGRA